MCCKRNNDLKDILNYLKEKRSLDFSGCRASMIKRRMIRRLSCTKSENYKDYFKYLQKNTDELDNLINLLTINVSRFFRDALTFEYIAARLLPAIISRKESCLNSSFRIWSAGCSMGEEPYSAAILLNEFFEKENIAFDVNIFATDIDENILKKAQKAVYHFESIKNIKYHLLKKYFSIKAESFKLNQKIKDQVSFSVFDILDKNCYAPPESIFGGFDILFCRNVLIYFNTKYQEKIFDKLYRALSKNGYLVLGEAEVPPKSYLGYFRKVNECCHIYQKK